MPLPMSYLRVTYDSTQQRYMVRTFQYGRVTTSAVVRTIPTIAVMAKQLRCPIYTDDHDLAMALRFYNLTVITSAAPSE